MKQHVWIALIVLLLIPMAGLLALIFWAPPPTAHVTLRIVGVDSNGAFSIQLTNHMRADVYVVGKWRRSSEEPAVSAWPRFVLMPPHSTTNFPMGVPAGSEVGLFCTRRQRWREFTGLVLPRSSLALDYPTMPAMRTNLPVKWPE